MQPRFRSDLTCSREEQQGVVFYRIDDPKSQTNFRLYEIEYLIAQKLDGQRALDDVIKAVKSEYNFDISEPDLTKFVSQLDSMGFIEKEETATRPPENADTRIMDRSRVQVEGDIDVLEDADLLEAQASPVDEAELKRLLKSALLHVRQGYIVHARDYFLAAKELNPGDAKLAKLVSHLEIIGDSSGPAEVDYLWTQARELYPEIAEEVLPLAEAKTGAPRAAAELPREPKRRDDDLRTRLIWLALLVVLVGGAGGALYYFAAVNHVFEGAAKVAVVSLRSQRLPVYSDTPAESVRAAREAWLQFAASGKVAEVSVTPGARVQTDQTLVSLALSPAADKQLQGARTAAKAAEDDHEKIATKLNALMREREALEAERNDADHKLDQLKTANLTGAGGAQKRDLDKWKKAKAKANKKLSALAKRERAPRQQELKAKQKLDQAKQKLEALEVQNTRKQVRAPFSGVVVEVSAKKGQNAEKDQKALLLRDNLEARLSFVMKDAGSLATGGEAFVSVARGVPSRAKVMSVDTVNGAKRVEISLVDPAGSFIDMKPQEFRLVREFVDRAFDIPVSALVTDSRGTHVLVELSGRAIARPVEALSRSSANAIIRDKAGTLRDGDRIVVDRLGAEGGVTSIADGSFLEVQQN